MNGIIIEVMSHPLPYGDYLVYTHITYKARINDNEKFYDIVIIVINDYRTLKKTAMEIAGNYNRNYRLQEIKDQIIKDLFIQLVNLNKMENKVISLYEDH